MAQPFDAVRGEFTGESLPLNASLAVRVYLGSLVADFSANAQGHAGNIRHRPIR
jgi:hypothetical protein